jgi:nucleoside-diphosphate-sugar epimerase
MKKVLVTGASGFIGGYIVEALLSQSYQVVGLDNLSKYGQVSRSFDNDEKYTFVKGDATDKNLLVDLMQDCDHVIAGAALIGGISYFHT